MRSRNNTNSPMSQEEFRNTQLALYKKPSLGNYNTPQMQSSAGGMGAGQGQAIYGQTVEPANYFPLRQPNWMADVNQPSDQFKPGQPSAGYISGAQEDAADAILAERAAETGYLANQQQSIEAAEMVDAMKKAANTDWDNYNPTGLPDVGGPPPGAPSAAGAVGDMGMSSGNPYLMAAGGVAKIFGAYQDGEKADKMAHEEQNRYNTEQAIGRVERGDRMGQQREAHKMTMQNAETARRNAEMDRRLKMASYKGRH